MTNEENESANIKASHPLVPQQDNRVFESIPVRTAPRSKSEEGKWYVAAMNDCIFIIDRKPRPAPVDYIGTEMDCEVCISMQSGSRQAQALAEIIVEAHNATVSPTTPSDGAATGEQSGGSK